MSRKDNSTRPQKTSGTLTNNPGGNRVELKGHVPKMKNPPPPPTKKK